MEGNKRRTNISENFRKKQKIQVKIFYNGKLKNENKVLERTMRTERQVERDNNGEKIVQLCAKIDLIITNTKLYLKKFTNTPGQNTIGKNTHKQSISKSRETLIKEGRVARQAEVGSDFLKMEDENKMEETRQKRTTKERKRI